MKGRSYGGITPLYLAAQRGYIKNMEVLIAAKADMEEGVGLTHACARDKYMNAYIYIYIYIYIIEIYR